MALQSSGRINLKQITTEFSDTPPHYMSEFYNGGSAGVSSNLIPSSGAIYFSDFYGATASTAIDSSAETVLLVKATGSGLENDAITYQNSSDVSTGFTETGKPQAGTFSPYRSGGYSTYFDGTGDYLTVSHDTSFDFGTGDYTVEFWINSTDASSTQSIVGTYNNGASTGWLVQLAVVSSAVWVYVYKGGTTLKSQNIDSVFSENTWHHIAVSREGTSLRIFVDGVKQGSDTTDSTSMSYTSDLYIGRLNHTSVTQYVNGYIRGLRIVKGTAVYTSNFTPPTESLTAVSGTSLLSCHLPYFGDGSTNDHSITVGGNAHTVPFGPYDYSVWTADDAGGSVYFDNTAGDRLVTSATSAIGTSDFTIEAWVYPNSFSTQEPIICCSDDTTGDTNNWQMNLDANGDLVFRYNGSTSVTTTAGTVLNTWNHVAVTATGGTIYLWVNGKTDTNVTYTHNYTDSRIKIGVNRNELQTFDGYIADARVIIGTAQYTSAFTPPTAPLSHTGSQTTLLMNNKSDANIYDAAAGNVLVSEDDIYGTGVTSNTAARKFTTSSAMFWSGDGNYLVVPDTTLLGFGTGDFTWEFWIWSNGIYPSYILEFGTGGDNGIHYPTSQGHLSYYNSTVGTGSTLYTTGFNTFDSSTWMHIAASRVNGTTYLFKDGTLTTSATDSHNYGTSNALYIGTYGASLGNYNFYGRMQDIRITKGKGRYTANFTPPTAEFEL